MNINLEKLHNVAWAYSHGITKSFYGAIPIYYSFAYSLKSTISVCLGSGGGSVPIALRQAQRDLNLNNSRTILIDGIMGIFGTPKDEGGWFYDNSFLKSDYPDIEIIIDTTDNAFEKLKDIKIDLLYIDAAHDTKSVITDFENYSKLMSDFSTIIFHDTTDPAIGNAIQYIRNKYTEYDVIDYPDLASGFAIVRKRKISGCENKYTSLENRPVGHKWTLGNEESPGHWPSKP